MGAVAGAVLGGVSMIFQGIGASQAAQQQAADAEKRAQIGKIQADQTDAYYRKDLNTTISNIRAIRAATGASADSPSTQAYIDTETEASDRVRRIKVGGLLMGVDQSLADAAFYRSSASTALLGGVLGAAGKIAGGLPPISL
jgi:hypothetical protein